MALKDLIIEIEYHKIMLSTILEYKNKDGICRVSQMEISKKIHKNHPWVQKAIKRLNAEDNCIEMVKKGEYIIHYTNIEERGVFPQIIRLIKEKSYNQDFTERNRLLTEKYGVTEKTIDVFRGYLALLYK